MSGPRPGAPVDWSAQARAAAAHVFVEDLDVPVLGADDDHHLRRVLRLRPGETVSVSDGTGGWRPCAYSAGGGLEPAGDAWLVPAARPPVTIGLAVPKGDRAEWAVQKLTEVGVDVVVPLVTARGVVRWDDERGERHRRRWAAVARQAAMQSRRVHLPVVGSPSSPAAMLAASTPGDAGAAGPPPAGAAAGGRRHPGPPLALAEPGGAPPALTHPTILIGPEGGWSAEERDLGLETVGLSAGVLRTETAAVVAAALLVALRAGLVADAAR